MGKNISTIKQFCQNYEWSDILAAWVLENFVNKLDNNRLLRYVGPIHLEDEMSFRDEIFRPGDEVLAWKFVLKKEAKIFVLLFWGRNFEDRFFEDRSFWGRNVEWNELLLRMKSLEDEISGWNKCINGMHTVSADSNSADNTAMTTLRCTIVLDIATVKGRLLLTLQNMTLWLYSYVSWISREPIMYPRPTAIMFNDLNFLR